MTDFASLQEMQKEIKSYCYNYENVQYFVVSMIGVYSKVSMHSVLFPVTFL